MGLPTTELYIASELKVPALDVLYMRMNKKIIMKCNGELVTKSVASRNNVSQNEIEKDNKVEMIKLDSISSVRPVDCAVG